MKEKAVFYARVSTIHEEQDSSIDSQIKMCEKYLKEHPDIVLAEDINEYCEKISAKSDNRPKYRKLLARIEQGDIRYIIIKDMKRISRASDVSAQLRNTLRKYKMKLIILSEGGCIKDPNADEQRMIYGFEALIAEEMVYTQSRYGRLAHKQKCEDKRLNRNNITFGYRWNEDTNDIEIDEEQAAIVKNIFEKYTICGMGVSEIQMYLNENGYEYSKNTIRKWLKQETYIGTFYLNQIGSELGVGIDGKTKRFVNPKEDWVPVPRPDLRIITDELFYLTQSLMNNKKKLYKQSRTGTRQSRFEGTSLFAGKIYCAECGKSYIHKYSDRKGTIGIYCDSFKIKTKNYSEVCPNKYKRLYETDLIDIYLKIKKAVLQDNENVADKLIPIIKSVIYRNTENNNKELKVSQQIAELQKKADDLTNNYVSAPENMKERILKLYNEAESQIKELTSQLGQIQNDKVNCGIAEERIKHIEIAVRNMNILDSEPDKISRSEIKKIINRIIINNDGVMKIYLQYPLYSQTDSCYERKDEIPLMSFKANYSSEKQYWNNVCRDFSIEVYLIF